MEAFESFNTFAEKVPNWIDRLETLSQQVSERHAEFTRLSRSSVGSIGSIRRKKTGSTESLRPTDDIEKTPTTSQPPTSPPTRVDINPDNKRLFQDFREQARRKRRSGSVLSATSGPQRFRARMSLIVYYDSAIQEGFEWLVRNISGARNTLRKGKTTASFKARLTSLGMEESPFIGDRSGLSLRNPKLPRLPRAGRFMTDGSLILEAFDTIDKELEAAQSLCEVGAHQFLRDGDCNDELSGAHERFRNCLRTAKEQVEELRFEAEKQKAEEVEREMEKLHREQVAKEVAASKPPEIEAGYSLEVDSTIHIDGSIAVDDSIQVDDIAVDTKPAPLVEVDDFGLGAGTIEIDDNDDNGSFHIDLTAFRKTRRY